MVEYRFVGFGVGFAIARLLVPIQKGEISGTNQHIVNLRKMRTSTRTGTHMETRSQKALSIKWELYTPQQQDEILAEFRKKLPDDYYCKATLFDFLRKKISMEEHRNKGESSHEISRTKKRRN